MDFLILRLLILLALHETLNATSPSCGNGGQHLICKTVEENFASNCERTTSKQQQVQSSECQLRIGKAGPKGDKGEPAEVNEATLGSLIEQRVNTATAKLQTMVQKLERDIYRINSTVFNITTQSTVDCTDGFLYLEKCYTFVTSKLRDVTLTKARLMCEERGQTLTYIVDSRHQYLVAEEMRKKIRRELEWTQTWLEMTHASSTKTMHFGKGEWALSTTFRWYTGYPGRSSGVNVAMESRRDPLSNFVGFFNEGPAHSCYGALCTN